MATKASSITTNREEIRRWVEERNGRPVRVQGTGGGEDPGLLRIDFPGYSGEEKLEEISGEEFFDKFEENKLAFLHQDRTHDGRISRFNKLVSRERAAEK